MYRELRAANIAAWEGQKPFKTTQSLDSSLKKNTAFIKKARMGLYAENLASFKKDIETLSLEKYISEVVSAVTEGLSKLKSGADMSAAVQICSGLHQRFTTLFTPFLSFGLVKGLAPPPASYLASLSSEQREKEDVIRLVKQRSLVRIVVELWLAGILRTVQDALDVATPGDGRKRRNVESLPIFVLRELLSNDTREFTNLSLATTFAKSYPTLLVLADDDPTEESTEGCSVADANLLKNILKTYLDSLTSHLIRNAKQLVREQIRLEENTLNHGSISATREASLTEAQRSHERQISGAQILAEALAQTLPDLCSMSPDEANDGGPSIIRGFGIDKLKSKEGEESRGIWEDDDQRRFYEELLDLKDVVPGDLLNDGQKRNTEKQMTVTEEEEITYEDDLEDLDSLDEESMEEHAAVKDESDKMVEGLDRHKETAKANYEEREFEKEKFGAAGLTIGAKLDALLQRLPELSNRDLIDKAAVEFTFLNSKASRNRLLRFLLSIPSSRMDLIPYYSRLIATLSRYLTIGDKVVEELHKDFRRFTKGKYKDLGLRLMNVRYLSELVKFGIVPAHVAFHCLKLSIESFTRTDLEVLSVFIENCGRFLLRSESTSKRMASVLQILMRKAQNVSGIERGLIENAFYYVNPPERASIVQKHRTDVELYICKLIHIDLSKRNYERVLRQLRKLEWKDERGEKWLRTIFTKVWKIRYSSIHLLSILVSGLSRYHPAFTSHVVDTVMEDIREGLEENRFRDNQKRIATIKYFGELYNYKLLDTALVFDTLYLLLNFGYPGGRPSHARNPLDANDDFFRVRLVLTLLDTCGICFDKGSSRKRLDLFLAFFQYYIKLKVPLTLDVEFAILDTFDSLRPALKLCSTLEEAATVLDEMVKLQIASSVTEEAGNALRRHNEGEGSGSDDSTTAVADRGEDEEDDDLAITDKDKREEEDEEEEEVVLLERKRVQDDLDKEAEEDFDREFGKMMTDSMDARKHETKRPLEINLPRKGIASAPIGVLASSTVDTAEQGTGISFTFLSKKGKAKTLALPSDSRIAIGLAAEKEREREEQQRIKNLVLNYENEYGRQDVEGAAARQGIKLVYAQNNARAKISGNGPSDLPGPRSGSMFRLGPQRTRRESAKEED